jgi:hypothetical protein
MVDMQWILVARPGCELALSSLQKAPRRALVALRLALFIDVGGMSCASDALVVRKSLWTSLCRQRGWCANADTEVIEVRCGRWTWLWRSHAMHEFENWQPRSVKCDRCKRIFIKNERSERFCSGCCVRSKRTERFGLGICGRCGTEFGRKASSQRYCSDGCREIW